MTAFTHGAVDQELIISLRLQIRKNLFFHYGSMNNIHERPISGLN
jgi:hypothetical protein